MRTVLVAALVAVASAFAPPAYSSTILYSNLQVNAAMAAGSRPASGSGVEIEAADDFIVSTTASVTEIKFIGLITGGVTVDTAQTNLEFYRVFPNDSDTTRTPAVPTRTNSPSDVAFDSRSFAD